MWIHMKSFLLAARFLIVLRVPTYKLCKWAFKFPIFFAHDILNLRSILTF